MLGESNASRAPHSEIFSCACSRSSRSVRSRSIGIRSSQSTALVPHVAVPMSRGPSRCVVKLHECVLTLNIRLSTTSSRRTRLAEPDERVDDGSNQDQQSLEHVL